MLTYEEAEGLVRQILEKEILGARTTFTLDDRLVDDLNIDGDDLSFTFVPMLEKRAGVQVPVDEWSTVATGREAARLIHIHLSRKIAARDALIAALVADATFHEAGNYTFIGKDYDKVESQVPHSRDPDLRAIRTAMTFWDSWIDARNHQWQYHEPFAEADWPPLARSIAADLSKGWTISNPAVLAQFDRSGGPSLRDRVTKLLNRILCACGLRVSSRH